MKNYRLATDGDILEMDCWPLFVENQFQAYETFWQRYVVPITNRPDNIHFKRDEELEELEEMGKGPHDVCLAQLHYTVLWHLHRAFEVLSSGDAATEAQMIEGILRLSSALDVADELLEKFTNPDSYDPWKETGKRGGKRARENWRNKQRKEMGEKMEPVEKLRRYRNRLVHGRIMPSIMSIGARDSKPVMGHESAYFDWRLVTDPDYRRSLDQTQFAPPTEILASAWEIALSYLGDMWSQYLLDAKGQGVLGRGQVCRLKMS